MITRYFILLVGVFCIFGCRSQKKKVLLFEEGVAWATIDDTRMKEASGLVASVNNPGMLWTHNDSGNSADLFLIDEKGDIMCTVHLPGIKNRDWEDIAIGSGPQQERQYIYIGEIGDNNAVYEEKILYRLEEPLIADGVTDTTLSKIDKIEFRLSDGKRDSEALIIDPVSKNFYIFSKRESQVNLYRLSGTVSTTEIVKAERVAEKLPFSMIVAADISEDGSEILAKNYDEVFYWKRLPGESVEETLKRTPQALPYTPEPQGESIAFSRNGGGYFTISEQKKKIPQQLYFYKRTSRK
jgi:hypothetical protein